MGHGVMQEIREQLSNGRSTGELIKAGYRPGSVYGALRSLKKAGLATGGERRNNAANLSQRIEEAFKLWHAPAPLLCPLCSVAVTHWFVCGHCGRMIPAECDCPEEFEELEGGFLLSDLMPA